MVLILLRMGLIRTRIEKWQDAAEYLAVGASVVELCTAVMWNGYQIIEKLNKGLEAYLEKKGYEAPAEITGKALSSIVSFPDLNLSYKLVASINDSCGLCVGVCPQGSIKLKPLL